MFRRRSAQSEENPDGYDHDDRGYRRTVEEVILPFSGGFLQSLAAHALLVAIFLSERDRVAAMHAMRMFREPETSCHMDSIL